MAERAVVQARVSLAVFACFIVLVATGSLVASFDNVDAQARELAIVVGRSFYEAITAAREWNTRHGGVYVPVTPDFGPDPVLRDARREITTRDGTVLTKVNHAEMVRLISEELTQNRAVRIHLTSLTPLQPANGPDPWERAALESFEHGAADTGEVVGRGGGALFRYMSPIEVEPSCVACHPEHRDPGAIRGGLGVSFPFAPFQRIVDVEKHRLWVVHAAFVAVGLLLVGVLGRRLLVTVAGLQEALLRIRKLEGLVPICASCKKIRREGTDPADSESWVPIEQFVEERTGAAVTHGLCPDCARKLYERTGAG